MVDWGHRGESEGDEGEERPNDAILASESFGPLP